MAAVIFEYIREYSFLYAGGTIVDAISASIKMEVPGIGDYLDSRFIPDSFDIQQSSNSEFLPNAKKLLKVNFGDEVRELETGICLIDAWSAESAMQKKLFQDEGTLRPYTMHYFDIPLIISQDS